jgi:hypothetical protein
VTAGIRRDGGARRRARQLLWGQDAGEGPPRGGKLFAILDAARDRRIYAGLQHFAAWYPVMPLYHGTAGDTRAGDTQAGDTRAGDTQAGDTQAGDTQAGETQAGDAGAAGIQAAGIQAAGIQIADLPGAGAPPDTLAPDTLAPARPPAGTPAPGTPARGNNLAAVGPYLLCLGDSDAVFDWIWENFWGDAWGIFLWSDASAELVWAHFRRHVLARTTDGERLVFRFYDPRILLPFLPTCDAGQLRDFFGPVQRFMLEDADGAALATLRRDAARLVIRSERLDAQRPS